MLLPGSYDDDDDDDDVMGLLISMLCYHQQDPGLPGGWLWGRRSGQLHEEDVGDDPPLRRRHPAEVALRSQAWGTLEPGIW